MKLYRLTAHNNKQQFYIETAYFTSKKKAIESSKNLYKYLSSKYKIFEREQSPLLSDDIILRQNLGHITIAVIRYDICKKVTTY